MSVEETLRNFIIQELNWRGAPQALGPTFNLIENDVLDSVGIFQIVSLLEDQFGIEVADQDLVPENFETIESMTRLIETKKPA